MESLMGLFSLFSLPSVFHLYCFFPCFFSILFAQLFPKVGMNVFTKEKEEDHSADSLPAQSSGLPLPVALGQQTEATAEATPAATIARAGTETEAPGRHLAPGGL